MTGKAKRPEKYRVFEFDELRVRVISDTKLATMSQAEREQIGRELGVFDSKEEANVFAMNNSGGGRTL